MKSNEMIFMNEVPARRDMEHVDLAEILQMLGAFFSRLLDLLLALWHPHVQVLDNRERRAFPGSNDHVRSALPDLCKRLLATFVLADFPDVAVWVGSGQIDRENPLSMRMPFASFTTLGGLWISARSCWLCRQDLTVSIASRHSSWRIFLLMALASSSHISRRCAGSFFLSAT